MIGSINSNLQSFMQLENVSKQDSDFDFSEIIEDELSKIKEQKESEKISSLSYLDTNSDGMISIDELQSSSNNNDFVNQLLKSFEEYNKNSEEEKTLADIFFQKLIDSYKDPNEKDSEEELKNKADVIV